MAAQTFPTDFPDEFRIESSSFVLVPMLKLTPTRSGLTYAEELGPALWRCSVRSGPLNMARMGVARGFIDSLSGINTFNAFDHWRQYPYAYRRNKWVGLTVGVDPFDGTCRLVSVAGDNVEIGLSLLPIGFVLTVGDMLSFDYGVYRALHRVVVGGTAGGGGTVTIEVRPEIRPGWAGSNSPPFALVSLYRAAARMFAVPGSYQEDISTPGYGRVSFSAVQSL